MIQVAYSECSRDHVRKLVIAISRYNKIKWGDVSSRAPEMEGALHQLLFNQSENIPAEQRSELSRNASDNFIQKVNELISIQESKVLLNLFNKLNH